VWSDNYRIAGIQLSKIPFFDIDMFWDDSTYAPRGATVDKPQEA
jgi:hypothetical protein